MKTKSFIIIAAFACLCIACETFSSDKTLTLTLPQIPALWANLFPDLTCSIEYVGISGKIESIDCAWGSGSVTISIQKSINSPILGIPHAHGFDLYPCGFVWPLDGKPERTENPALTWEHGFISSILMILVRQGFETRRINIPKLESEIEKKSFGSDPWTLDRREIIERLASGNFSTYYIDELPRASVVLSPVIGDWCSENPFSGVLSADEYCTLGIGDMTYGFHRFFNVSSHEILDVNVSDNETLWVQY